MIIVYCWLRISNRRKQSIIYAFQKTMIEKFNLAIAIIELVFTVLGFRMAYRQFKGIERQVNRSSDSDFSDDVNES